MIQTAVITGACGGIGTEISRALAIAGYRVVMACRDTQKAGALKERLVHETGNSLIDIVALDLSLLQSVRTCTQKIITTYGTIHLLMNNAGTISTGFRQTEEGIEETVCTNYIGHYLLTRRLAEYMPPGSRIVNMISCTYPLGRLDFPHFFTHGRKGRFFRLAVYSNTKLALLLFTHQLSKQLKEKGITVNAADPGIVSTNMIAMHQWVIDSLANIFFRPFIRTPRTGASGAIRMLLDPSYSQYTGYICTVNKIKKIPEKYINHTQQYQLWEETERLVQPFL
ncbi:MAG: SDR family NAD(P)-dependent oxidoreductase [Tannerellaceae bacterium]|nr:SDR family NAD(P)-dependent oxidoreductase [Tannerellaceae bacterium]